MKKRWRIYFTPDFLFVFALAVLMLLVAFGAITLLLCGVRVWNALALLCALPLAAWLVFRVLSHNLPARAKENQVFCFAFFAPVRFVRKLLRKMFPDRKHVRAHCPSCGAGLRLMNEKGDFMVTCPKCGARFPIHIR